MLLYCAVGQTLQYMDIVIGISLYRHRHRHSIAYNCGRAMTRSALSPVSSWFINLYRYTGLSKTLNTSWKVICSSNCLEQLVPHVPYYYLIIKIISFGELALYTIPSSAYTVSSNIVTCSYRTLK